MTKFTKDVIILIHDDQIRMGGMVHGILCDGTIDYILNNIEDASGVFSKAAWALYMSRQHPFFDGNKRTSFILAATILKMNGYYLGRQDEDEIFDALHKISDANVECDIERIEQWLKKKSKIWWKMRQRNLGDYL
jgi:death on curing protein